MKMIGDKFLVKLVDFGDKKEIDHEDIFRPLQKYVHLERQAFKMRLDGEYSAADKPVGLIFFKYYTSEFLSG